MRTKLFTNTNKDNPAITKEFRPVRRALISVSDKTGIVKLASILSERGVELLSTSGTYRLLARNGINVIEVSKYTGYPEMMGGRLKTLNPKVHGGILGRRGIDDVAMNEHGIPTIDMVVVNLYPFSETAARADCPLEEAVENIDIGGPAMVRSAAKNHRDVAILVNPDDYDWVIREMVSHSNSLTYSTRFTLAVAAFKHTAAYDNMISDYFDSLATGCSSKLQQDEISNFPSTIKFQFRKRWNTRYGENSHQQAAFYVEPDTPSGTISSARQLQGKALSYNNIVDADSALECIKEFDAPACVIVKHTNPCCVAVANNIFSAYQRAFRTDPKSAFGGIIAFNRELDSSTAEIIIAQQFVEVIIIPSVSSEAQQTISAKKNIRLLEYGQRQNKMQGYQFKHVNGGLLVQDRDDGMINLKKLKVVTKRSPTKRELSDALFGWKVAKYVKSNAIVYAKNNMTIGIGAGQMSRVYSAKIASIKASDGGLNSNGSIMASDAFLPFRDSIDVAAKDGVTCIIQPGGSIHDDEVVASADEHNIAMVFTNMRHLFH